MCRTCERNPAWIAIVVVGLLVLFLPYIAPIIGAILLFYLAIKFFEKTEKTAKKFNPQIGIPIIIAIIFFLAIFISLESSGMLDNVDIGQAIKDFLDLNPD